MPVIEFANFVSHCFRPMKSRSAKARRKTGIGAAYLLKLTLLATGLMILNSFLMGKFVEANIGSFPMFFQDVRVYQFAQVVLPFLLVLLQFRVYDWIRDRYFPVTDLPDASS